MHSPTPPASLLQALRRVMRPLVRLMLRKGVTYTYFSDMVKGVFVEIAAAEFRLDEKPPTDSRISLITGVHRKDVRRLREGAPDLAGTLPQALTLGAHLVSIWMNRAPFCDSPGRPSPLPRLASVGGEQSFDSLVASASKDIRARVVLDEWLRLGVVRMDDQDRVHLQTRAFVPQKGFDEKAAYFGHNIHDHACAAVHNLTVDGPPFFERSVHYDSLSPMGVEEIRAVVSTEGMEALMRFNELASALEARDAVTPTERQRVTIGLFFYTEPTTEPSATETGR